ncbi:MAG: response regulator [Kangiellaceae bacterium]|nr:response regulator [Kangiellaceae bacterium]
MNNWGIRARVILLALIPTAIVAIVMGAYFVTARVQDLDSNVRDRGITIANYVAQTSVYSLLSRNNKSLTRLVTSARDGDEDIMAIAIFTKNNLLLASSGTKELIAQLAGQSTSPLFQTSIIEQADEYIIRAPIISQQINSQSSGHQSGINTRTIGYVSVTITSKNIRLRQYQTIATALVILIIGLILGGVLAQNMSRNITIPIIQLANAVKRIKEGQLKVEIKAKSNGELQTLVEGFNDMSDSLYEAREEMQMAIEQATADINATNTALEEQNVELNIARKEALEASRVKSEFLANMSHEIRTPMNGVIGFTNLLLNSTLTEKQNDYLSTIKKSADGLLSIIDNILDFSKIEAGKMVMENRPVVISDCIDETLNLLAPSAQAKGIEIIGIIYQDVPQYIMGDAGRICQILTNRCNNAIKFTRKGTIQIKVMLDDENAKNVRLRFSVTDTGVGLTEEQQKVLFQAFTQADTTTTRRFGGTGLGLVISKKLVESMNGKIGLESQENIGSTFWFTIKLDKNTEFRKTTELGFPGRRVLFHDANKVSQQASIFLMRRWGVLLEDINSLEVLVATAASYEKQNKSVHLILLGGYHPEQYSKEQKILNDLTKRLNITFANLINSKEEKTIKEFTDFGLVEYLSKPITRMSFYAALHNWFDIQDSSVTRSKTTPALNSINKQTRILCVDDNNANLKLINAFLSEFEVDTELASNGIEAVELCEQKEFDIVFMDIQMPGMDGLKATKLIRKINTPNLKLPIIALTAHAMKGEKERLISEGMDDYLTKPINQEQLKSCIKKWTNREIRFKKSRENRLKDNSSEQTSESIKKSIDWELSIKNAGGREDLAKEMLTMLVDSFEESTGLIEKYSKEQQLTELIEQVHKLHGATAYCGVPNLKFLAHQYESLLKTTGFNEQFIEVHRAFISETHIIRELAPNFLS